MTDKNDTITIERLSDGIKRFNESFDEHSDSYINAVSGLGVPGTSKSGATFFGRDRLLQSTELQNLYQSNAYATRIVDRMVDDATRTQWYLTGVDRSFDWLSVKSQIDDLAGLAHIGDAWRWARLYGGGLVVMAIDDGQPYNKPLDLAKAKAIRGLSTLDSTSTMVNGWTAALGSNAWTKPTGYQVITPWKPDADMGTLSSDATIHPTRVIRFDGCRVPASLMVTNGGWAPSVLQRCKRQLEAYGTAYGYVQEILHDLSVMMVKLPGFTDMCLGDNGIADAREILRQLKWGIDNLNLLVIDSASEYQEVKRSVEGMEKLIKVFEADLVGASGMTRLILVGEQASGLGASSSDEIRSWYSSVETEQEFTVTPAINELLRVVFACRRNAGEQVPTEWKVKWHPLWTPEPKAKAEIAQIWANTVKTLIESNIIDADGGKAMLVANGVLEDVPQSSMAVGTTPDPDDIEEPEPAEPVEIAPEQEPMDEVISSDPVPADAMTAQAIAAQLGVKTIRVTRLVGQGRVRLWNKLGNRVISLAEVHAVIESDNQAMDAAAKGDGKKHSLTVMVVAPRSIAQWVPYQPDAKGPPHVTIVHADDVGRLSFDAIVDHLRGATRMVHAFGLCVGEVGYFDHEDERIAFASIAGESLPALHALVTEALMVNGVAPNVHAGGYTPHMTLARVAPGENYCGASPPVGSAWVADAIEVRHGDTVLVLPLVC